MKEHSVLFMGPLLPPCPGQPAAFVLGSVFSRMTLSCLEHQLDVRAAPKFPKHRHSGP